MKNPDRRWVLSRLLTGFAAATLAACDRVSDSAPARTLLNGTEKLTLRAHRLLSRTALAREFPAQDLSRDFRANGTTDPPDPVYRQHVQEHFANWQLELGGMVRIPLKLTLAELRAMPARTQITRHDCVEGWSAIGKWTGIPLGALLQKAGLLPSARYLVFYCSDQWPYDLIGSGTYYTSIDLVDALHPQTILAYEMNDQPLPVRHGAPVRLRVERQLGYKMAKYVMRIEAVASFDAIEGGLGGYWEDRGYEWYAGV